MSGAGGKRVLVVDDSAVVRKLVVEALSAAPTLAAVSTASNGRLALERIEQLAPDLVVLDVEMPELDGIATLRALRARSPQLPVLMFSALTERAGELTLQALAEGASDYVPKPTSIGGTKVTPEETRSVLRDKVHALLTRSSAMQARRVEHDVPAEPKGVREAHRGYEVIAIGASVGGPNALHELLGALPAPLRVPIVIVQHMPAMFTPLLAQRLATRSAPSARRTRHAEHGATLHPGDAWIAQGDRHLQLQRDRETLRLLVTDGPPRNACRPSVDVLFESVASVCGARALGVVLTGMGRDGLSGCRALRHAGADVLVQDESSSVVWSMPGCVANAGLADAVVPLHRMAQALCDYAARAQ